MNSEITYEELSIGELNLLLAVNIELYEQSPTYDKKLRYYWKIRFIKSQIAEKSK